MNLSLFPEVATYRDGTLAGHRGVETSREAAEGVSRVLNARQLEVLRALVKLRTASADEIADALGRRNTSVRPRATELKAQGLIAWTGEKRRTRDGCNAFVWKLSRKGLEHLSQCDADVCHEGKR
jgi:predicted ArsR family transcriptional regulator